MSVIKKIIKISLIFIFTFAKSEHVSYKNHFCQSIKNYTKCHNTPRDDKFECEIQSKNFFLENLISYFFISPISTWWENSSEREKKLSEWRRKRIIIAIIDLIKHLVVSTKNKMRERGKEREQVVA